MVAQAISIIPTPEFVSNSRGTKRIKVGLNKKQKMLTLLRGGVRREVELLLLDTGLDSTNSASARVVCDEVNVMAKFPDC